MTNALTVATLRGAVPDAETDVELRGVARPLRTAAPDRHGSVRGWLARELHDGAVQTLTCMVVELEHLKRDGDAGLPATDRLDGLQRSTRSALDDLRHLLDGLRDEPGSQTGFAASIGTVLDGFTERTGIAGELVVGDWPDLLPRHTTHNLRRIIEEALSNVRRHSGARGVVVTLESHSDDLLARVSDDGRGMDASETTPGMGTRGMHERAVVLGGEVRIESTPRHSTTVHVRIPRAQLR